MAMVVLDRFDGVGNPADWIYRAERYFTFLGFSEEHWLPLPSLYGEALEWFRWMFRNEQFFDWNHFKEKFALCFQKRTYAKSHVVDVQLTRILTLLQKLEDKCSTYTSKQIIADDVSISTATDFRGKIDFSIEENPSPVDNIEGHSELFASFIYDHSSHEDNMFDEMSTEDLTKEVVQTSSASSFVPVLENIPSPKVFDECFHSCCPMIVAEVSPDTLNKMFDEEAPGPKHSEALLFNECSPKDMSKRYVTATSLDCGSTEQKIEFETFDDMYLAEFFLEPENIEDLYLDKYFLEIKDSIPRGNMPSDELVVVEHGRTTDEFSANNILCQFSFNPGGIIFVHETVTKFCIWDPGISFEFKALIGYTVNMRLPLLLGSTAMFGFIAYANSVTQVWDPGQQRCMHSSILPFVLALAVVTSLKFGSRDTFAKWAVPDKMVMTESKVDDTYSEVNRMFDDSSQRFASREIQPIAPLDIIRLPKLFRFRHQLLSQLIFVSLPSEVGYAAIGDFSLRKKIIEQVKTVCIEWLQGCIKSMANLIEQDLRNFYTLEEIMVYFGAQGIPTSYATGPSLEFEYMLIEYGVDEFIILIMHDILDPDDKIVDCPPSLLLYEFAALQTCPFTFSLYEFAALLSCEKDHWSLIVIESELELVKVASIVVSYDVHKAMLNESESTFIMVSCGKFIITTRLMCYISHFGGRSRVEECTVVQRVLESNPVLKAFHNVSNTIRIKFLSHHGISVQIQLAELGKIYGAAMGPSLVERSRAFLIKILEQNHHCFSLLGNTLMDVNKKCSSRDLESFSYLKQSHCNEIEGITNVHDSVNIKEEMKIVGLSKREQMAILRIVASVMILGNLEFSEGNEIVFSILQVDRVWFHLRTTIAALYTHTSLERFNIILFAWLYSNLEDQWRT